MMVMSNSIVIGSTHFRMIETGKHSGSLGKKWSGKYLNTWPVATALQNLLPKDRTDITFYFQPLKNPRTDCWFSTKPTGHNTLQKTVARLCQKAQIPGFRTNYSPQATAASRLFHASIDEQITMEMKGVWSYQRTSDDQREGLSDILNSGSKFSVIPQSPSNLFGQRSLTESDDWHKQLQPTTQQHLHTSQSLTVNILPPQSFSFNSCSVNIDDYNVPH